MLPELSIPVGPGAGIILMVIAAGWFLAALRWGWRDLGRYGAAVPALLGIGLVARGTTTHVPWPTYGLTMLTGCLFVIGLSLRWGKQRGIEPELILELCLLGGVCGLIGARIVHICEQWDARFADQPPALGASLERPLSPGDTLHLKTQAGDAAVIFSGEERDPEALASAISAAGEAADIEVLPQFVQHRGPHGIERTPRGVLIRTRHTGKDAVLEVLPGSANAKLGLPNVHTRTRGVDVPLSLMFDLRKGGLTYYGSVFGVMLAGAFWLRFRKQKALPILDVFAPTFALGLFFGRLGCLARGCCWGRELGGGSVLPGLSFPPWSPAWQQMAQERLGCAFNLHLAERTLTPEMTRRLSGLIDGTPPLHAAQLYEGCGVLLIFFLLWFYRSKLQTRVGQTFCLLVLLQAPLRFAVEHMRRDHSVFPLTVAGYPFTSSQIVALGLGVLAVPALWWVSRHGEPIHRDDAQEADAAPVAEAARA